jgi:GT2 family glycosyltransferase
VERSKPLQDLAVAERYERAMLIVRDDGRPAGRVEVRLSGGRLSAEECARAIETVPAAAPLAGSEEALASPPSATVVVCTHGRGTAALGTVEAFEALEYAGEVEIIVVDNAPLDDALQRAMEARAQTPGRPVRRVLEPVPGLSQARNRALAVATGEIIAFTDDDALPEPQWLHAIAAALASEPDAASVSGLTLPTELETPAQEWCERLGGLNKGRGFTREVYRPGQLGGRHPLYPYPTFGAGVNMAFRTQLLRQIGGFSHALGVGNGTGGGEDTAIFAEVLVAGGAIVYEPAATVGHTHRRAEDELKRQMHGYGMGITSYFAWALHRHPRQSLGLAGNAGRALRYLATRGRSHRDPADPDVPSMYTAELRRGLLHGPMAYLRAVREDRRQRRRPGAAGLA